MVQNEVNQPGKQKGKSVLLRYTGLTWFSFAIIGQCNICGIHPPILWNFYRDRQLFSMER